MMSAPVDHEEASADRTEDRALAKRMWAHLTKAEREFVESCEYWTGRDDAVGCGAKGGKQQGMAERLANKGLIVSVGQCVSLVERWDRYTGREVYRETYAITNLGRLATS